MSEEPETFLEWSRRTRIWIDLAPWAEIPDAASRRELERRLAASGDETPAESDAGSPDEAVPGRETRPLPKSPER